LRRIAIAALAAAALPLVLDSCVGGGEGDPKSAGFVVLWPGRPWRWGRDPELTVKKQAIRGRPGRDATAAVQRGHVYKIASAVILQPCLPRSRRG
jgi:hypothetical protein